MGNGRKNRGWFRAAFSKITDYLNGRTACIISVAYENREDSQGHHHIYRLYYIEPMLLHGIVAEGWEAKGKQYRQMNSHDVEFSLRPSMSWQIWRTISVDQPAEVFDFV